MNDAIQHKVNSEQDIDDLLTTIRTQGLDVVQGEAMLPHAAMEQRLEEAAEDIDLNPSSGAPEADNDTVRVYLREMGPRLCSPTKGRWTLPSASSADNSPR